jgi:hypothetical protein
VILSLCWYGFAPVGVELSLASDFILTEKLMYEQVAFYQVRLLLNNLKRNF